MSTLTATDLSEFRQTVDRESIAHSKPHALAQITLRGISVRYGRSVALHPTDLSIEAGEVIVLLGPSGSGKSTILRAIAGFVEPTSGRIQIGGVDMTQTPPHDRGLGIVVQNYALFPHMSVADNVGFGLRARRRPRTEVDAAVGRYLDLVGMSSYAKRYPRELSGGQQQRVAIARALAIEPSVLLLDEPLSALDAPLRSGMLDELLRLHDAFPRMSIVYVTHDQSEAIRLANRIVLMREGRVAAIASPRELHDFPPSRYAAEFFGQANLLPAKLRTPRGKSDGLVGVDVLGQSLRAKATATSPHDGEALLCLRPHDLQLGRPSELRSSLEAVADRTLWMGSMQRLTARIGDLELRVDLPSGVVAPTPGSLIQLYFDPTRAVLLPRD